jgi:CheY-like chemotaxis protein/anti-sigma regulatory factor (Ser/Thr protein kinase)
MAKKRRPSRKSRGAATRRQAAVPASAPPGAGPAVTEADALRALGELAGGAAHHLNNLLTIVVGRVQLLLRSTADDRMRRSLEIVERASKDAAEVVRRLQQFARMRRVEQPRMVDVNTIAAEVVEATRPRWQEGVKARGVTIDVERRFGSVPAVPGDPLALREALANVVINAVDAMPKGGRIVIETALKSRMVAVSVADDGTGMSEEVRRRAHEPFFTTKGVKATGLGLSVAYGIVRRHGGDLAVKTVAGRGTTVMFRLPVAAVVAPATPPIIRRGSTSLHILLVEDEVEVAEALAEMLTATGHVVVTAGSGAAALSHVESEPGLDLVLTDLVMPGMTGWEVAAAVKARRPRLAVGLITGEASAIDAAHVDSVDFVIGKPLSVEAFNSAVARMRQ